MLQAPMTMGSGYPTASSFGNLGGNQYSTLAAPCAAPCAVPYQAPGNPMSSGSAWGMGQDAFSSGNGATLGKDMFSSGITPTLGGGLAPASSFGVGSVGMQMPRAQSSMLTSTTSFGGVGNGSGYGMNRSTSHAMSYGPFTFTAEPQGPPGGSGHGVYANGTEQVAPTAQGSPPGQLGPPSNSAPSQQPPAAPQHVEVNQNLQSQPSWSMQQPTVEAPVPPAARGRSGVLEKQQNATNGVTQEPCGCTRQLDDCVARCRKEVQALAEQCRRRGQKYCDPDFPADARALYINGQSPSRPSSQEAMPAAWSRASEGAFSKGGGENSANRWLSKLTGASSEETSAQVLLPGPMGGVYFLSALAALRTIGTEPRELIVWREPAAGVYGVRLFKDGEWMYEILDDFLPMDQHHQPACSRALANGDAEDWLALIEKAYAKIHGSYEAIGTGSEAEALEDVLGMGSNRIDMREFPIWGELWQHLRSRRRRGYCMIASHHSSVVGQALGSGLVSGHGYPLGRLEMLDGEMLVELENPWVHGSWNGRWGERSSERKSASAHATRILEPQYEGSRNFWMSIQDFCKHFTDVVEARGISPYWQMAAVMSATDRPSYPLISVAQPTQAIFVLSQSDRRWGDLQKYSNAIGLRVYRSRVVAPPRNAVGVKQNVSSPFKNLELLAKKPLTKAHSVVVEIAKFEPNSLYIAAIDSEYRSVNLLLRVFTACAPRFRELSQPETQYLLQAQATAPNAADHDSFSSQGSQNEILGPRMRMINQDHVYAQPPHQHEQQDDGWQTWEHEPETETVHLPKMIQACINTCSYSFGNFRC